MIFSIKTELIMRETMVIIIYFAAAVFLVYELALQIIPSLIANNLIQDFSISAFGLSVISASFFITYTYMPLPVGIIFEKLGMRLPLSLAIIACILGTLLFSMPNFALVLVGRILMRFGGAFAFVGTLLIATQYFSHNKFSFLAGLTQFLAAIGPLFGQIILFHLILRYDWRNVSFSSALLGLGLLAIFLLACPKSQMREVLSNKAPVLSNLQALIKNKQTWVIGGYAMMLWAPMATVASLWSIPYLELCYKLSKAQSATICSFMWFGIALASPLFGWLMEKLQHNIMMLRVCPLIGLIGFSLIWLQVFDHILIIILLMFAAGMACAGQALSFAVINKVTEPERLSSAYAFNNMAIVISGLLFQPIIGLSIDIFAHRNSYSLNLLSSENIHYALLIVPGFYLLSLVASFYIKRPTQLGI